MRLGFPALAAAALALGGCASSHPPQGEPGAAALGIPRVAAAPLPADAPRPEPALPPSPTLPERIGIPASYRLILVDGHWMLVRETDAQALDPGPGSIRATAGEPDSGGDPSFHPAPLPQELAAELEASRQSAARMDNALAAVMERSRELTEQARTLEAEAKRLAALVADRGPAANGPSVKAAPLPEVPGGSQN